MSNADNEMVSVRDRLGLKAQEAQAAFAADQARLERVQALLARAAAGQARIEVVASPSRDAAGATAWGRRAIAAVSLVAGAAAVHMAGCAIGQSHPVAESAATVASAAPDPHDGARSLSPSARAVLTQGAAGRRVMPEQFLAPVVATVNGHKVETLNPLVRVEICREVAKAEGLAKVGLDWKDVYAAIHAETAWVPRDGMGHNGRVSRGLAQLEDQTAKLLGIDDPEDPRQAATATARLLKEAAVWAGKHAPKAALSVYYNLSTKARNEWDRHTVSSLPPETQFHITNFADGRRIAEDLGHQRDGFDMRMALANSQTIQRHELPADSVAVQLRRAAAGAPVRMTAGGERDYMARLASSLDVRSTEQPAQRDVTAGARPMPGITLALGSGAAAWEYATRAVSHIRQALVTARVDVSRRLVAAASVLRKQEGATDTLVGQLAARRPEVAQALDAMVQRIQGQQAEEDEVVSEAMRA